MPDPDRLDIVEPSACPAPARAGFIRLVQSAGEVDAGLPYRVGTAKCLLLLYRDGALVGTAAIKNPHPGYHGRVFEKAAAGLLFTDYPRELGWIVVDEGYRGRGLSRTLTEAALAQAGDSALYATTRLNNDRMLDILPDYGFERVGTPYKSIEHPGEQIVLFVRPRPGA